MNTLGRVLHVTVFGQSHSAAIGCIIDGFPAGLRLDKQALAAFMSRRAPGRNAWSTKRQEADAIEAVSGFNAEGVTCGAPLALLIKNTHMRPQDYDELSLVPRPSHADLAAWRRWGSAWDNSGGGQFSGRLTAPLCAAGGVCLQWLSEQDITLGAHLAQVANISDVPLSATSLDPLAQKRLQQELAALRDGRSFPTLSIERGEAMQNAIETARLEQDSVGGVIEAVALGVPPNLGDPMFGGVESQIAQGLFGVPAVKGVEFGAGFGAAAQRGSVHNDPYAYEEGMPQPIKNDAGGIVGGITTGAPLVVRAAIKPTPSIAKPQASVDLGAQKNVELIIRGRHDPCIAPRAVPVVEAVLAICLTDLLLQKTITITNQRLP